MFVIGVTGGIGSGKSSVCKILNLLGVPIFIADDEAKLMMVEDHDLVKKIKDLLGSCSYNSDGSLNREYISNSIFKDRSLLSSMNSVVHPALFCRFNRWVAKMEILGYRSVVFESAILIETERYKEVDYTVVVTAPLEERILRVLSRNRELSREQVLDRIDKQIGDSERNRVADRLINSGGSEMLTPQVIDLYNKIRYGKI